MWHVTDLRTRFQTYRGISNVRPWLLQDLLNITQSQSLGLYLGAPIFVGCRSSQEGWQSKLLSMAGRVTLIKSVSSTIPNYIMQTSFLPTKPCHAIDRIHRNFLWCNTPDHKRFHAISWDIVSQPKVLGGLGICKAKISNQAMLMNLSWRLWKNPKSF